MSRTESEAEIGGEGPRPIHDVFLVDSTVRSLQSAVSGSRHSREGLIAVGVEVDRLGVREQIVNVAWRDGFEVLTGLAKAGVRSKKVATIWARSPDWKALADRAAASGADQICLESSPAAEDLSRAADYVRTLGMSVSHGFAEVYTHGEVVTLLLQSANAGIESHSFHDSFFRGRITPERMSTFVKTVLAEVPGCPPLYLHLSNFFGHATMTAVAGVVAGATAIDVCLNNTGHHCGHTSLPEVAVVLKHLYGVDTGIDLELLREVSLAVEAITGIPVPATKPVVGDFAFAMDGTYWALEAHLPSDDRVHATYPFAPESVGTDAAVVWSRRTATRAGIGSLLRLRDLDASTESVDRVMEALDVAPNENTGFPSWVTQDELDATIRDLQLEAATRPT